MGFKDLMNLDQARQENGDSRDFDDAEETLSLCDLALDNCTCSDWDESSFKEGESSCSSSSSSDQDYFEFFSEDLTAAAAASASASASDNIIFCGKLIPYKEAGDKKPESCSKSRMVSSKKQQGRNDFSMKKVSVLATPLKSRWYLFAFGVGRFPMGMELNDMKKRQNKKCPARMFSSSDGGREVIESGEKRTKGLWSLLKVLGRRNNDANTVVKASFGCIPRF